MKMLKGSICMLLSLAVLAGCSAEEPLLSAPNISDVSSAAVSEAASASSLYAPPDPLTPSVPVDFDCLFCPNDEVKNDLPGIVIDYMVIHDGNEAYELLVSDKELSSDPVEVLATVFVSARQPDGSFLLQQSLAVPGKISPNFAGSRAGVRGGLFLADVDFDGQKGFVGSTRPVWNAILRHLQLFSQAGHRICGGSKFF